MSALAMPEQLSWQRLLALYSCLRKGVNCAWLRLNPWEGRRHLLSTPHTSKEGRRLSCLCDEGWRCTHPRPTPQHDERPQCCLHTSLQPTIRVMHPANCSHCITMWAGCRLQLPSTNYSNSIKPRKGQRRSPHGTTSNLSATMCPEAATVALMHLNQGKAGRSRARTCKVHTTKQGRPPPNMSVVMLQRSRQQLDTSHGCSSTPCAHQLTEVARPAQRWCSHPDIISTQDQT